MFQVFLVNIYCRAIILKRYLPGPTLSLSLAFFLSLSFFLSFSWADVAGERQQREDGERKTETETMESEKTTIVTFSHQVV